MAWLILVEFLVVRFFSATSAISRRYKPILAIALALVIVGGGQVAEASPGGFAVYGFDVSFPQCKSGLPTPVAGHHVVGVNGGRPFTANPCFGAELQWASAGNSHPAIYMNLDYPMGGEAAHGNSGPHGQCRANDQGCKAFNYGFNAAADAVGRAGSAGHTVWWLDIETANHWSPNPSLNAQIIQGALSYFQSHQIAIGIYSIGPMWESIAGGYAPGVPLWVASWRANVPTVGYCSPGYAFGGGTVAMVQTYNGSLDINFLCPGAAWPHIAAPIITPSTKTAKSAKNAKNANNTLASSRGGNSVRVTSSAVSPGQWVTYQLSFSPGGANAANGLFVTAYQDGIEVLRVHATDTPTPGSLELKIQSHSASPLVFQLTTYDDPAAIPAISYSLRRV